MDLSTYKYKYLPKPAIYKVVSKPGNPGDPSSLSTQLPFRRLSQQDYDEVHEYWQLYKGNHSQRLDYYHKFIHRVNKEPLSNHCHHESLALFHKYCTWKKFLQQCYIPCHLIAPNYTVTLVSQSIVSGQGSATQEMYLQPLPFERINTGLVVAAMSFVDCVIDPAHFRKHRGVYNCRRQQMTEFDSFGWGLREEFFPDPGAPGQYKLSLPEKIPFSFNLLKDYVDPTITYNPNPTNESMKTVTKDMYVSPYFNCIRVSTESMRNAILTAAESYWTSTIVEYAVMTGYTYSYTYYAAWPSKSNNCGALPVRILLFWKACKLWNIPSRVKRIYGFCEVIFPIGLVHSSYAALIDPVTPPEGCRNRENSPAMFDMLWGRNRGYGLSSSVKSDVYPEWNNYCEGCGYTRSMHRRNVIKAWIGEKKYVNPHCLPSTENNMSTGELEFPQTVGSKWNKRINDVVVLWKLRAEYSCWNETTEEWQFNVRPTTYHPYGIRHESGDMCQRIMPIALNALDCHFPCKSEDESEDCNSRCPHENHNICDHPLDTLFNLKIPPVGLNYFVFLTENGSPCKINLQGMMGKVQGLGIFGPFGRNIVQCERGEIAQCRKNRRGNVIYSAQSHQLEELSKSVFYPAIIATKNTTKRQNIDVTENLWGDRMLVVFNHWFQNYTRSQAYSNICAAFEGIECKVESVSWNLESIPPEFTPAQYLYYPRFNLNPWNHLDIQYNSACTQNDQDLIRTLYDTLPNGTYPEEYGCIVKQLDRNKKNNSLTAEEWEEQFMVTVRDAVTVGCTDTLMEAGVHGRSHFGFPLPWNNLARYLDGVSVADCAADSCLKDPRKVEGADYCQRVLDPEESIGDLPECQLI